MNECDTDNGGCSQICDNGIGHFNCSCYVGNTLDTNKLTCRGEHFDADFQQFLIVLYNNVYEKYPIRTL